MNRFALPLAVAGALTAALVSVPSSAGAASTGGARIVAIYFDSPGADRGGNASLDAEWVKIRNVTGSRKTLTGWTLRDSSRHVYHFPTFSLAAGATVRIHTGSGSRNGSNLYWGSGRYIWNNTGDRAALKNARGTLVDSCAYTQSADPEAFC